MRIGKQMSTGALMTVIVLVAIELAQFQGVMQILVIPPVTIMVLAINLGLFFLVVRPPALETRIIGMLLGGVAALFADFAALLALSSGLSTPPVPVVGDLRRFFANWASTLPDQEALTVTVIRFLSVHIVVIGFALLDLLGVAMIWAGGWVESRWRRRRVRARALAADRAAPLDDRALTPL